MFIFCSASPNSAKEINTKRKLCENQFSIDQWINLSPEELTKCVKHYWAALYRCILNRKKRRVFVCICGLTRILSGWLSLMTRSFSLVMPQNYCQSWQPSNLAWITSYLKCSVDCTHSMYIEFEPYMPRRAWSETRSLLSMHGTHASTWKSFMKVQEDAFLDSISVSLDKQGRQKHYSDG